MSLYDILGLDKSATKEQIKRAAKAAMQACHPDRAGGDEAKFKQINSVKRLLIDDTTRKRYDETGSTEERPEEVTDEMHAISVLSKLFIAILEKDQHGSDLVHEVSVEIIKGLAGGPPMIAAHKKKIAKVERTLKKHLKQKPGKPGYLQNALTGHLQVLKTHLAQMELSQRIGPLMLEILKDYTWEADARPASQYSVFQQLYSDATIKSLFDNYKGP